MINTILDRLSKVKPHKNNQWTACCPAHDDKHPSLAIKLTDGGTILFKCWSGCRVDDICASIGINVADLFPERIEDRAKFSLSAETAWRILRREAIMIRLIAGDVKNNVPIDYDRLALSENRLQMVCEYLDKNNLT